MDQWRTTWGRSPEQPGKEAPRRRLLGRSLECCDHVASSRLGACFVLFFCFRGLPRAAAARATFLLWGPHIPTLGPLPQAFVPQFCTPFGAGFYRAAAARQEGKTSLTHQFVEGEFLESCDPTVENTYSKIVTLGKDEFHLPVVHTAGQDEYSILPYSFIIGVHGYVLVYSVTSLHSFYVIESLYQKLHQYLGKTRLPVVLIENKAAPRSDS